MLDSISGTLHIPYYKAMDKIQKKSERWLEFMAGTHVEILNSLEYLWLL